MTVQSTAPAQQARNLDRMEVLGKIQQSIVSLEGTFTNRLDLYRLVILIADRKLVANTLNLNWGHILVDIPWPTRDEVLRLLLRAERITDRFQRAPEEGLALWAKIYEWAAAQIVSHHLSALQALEASNPQLIFGAESAMTEVPIE